MKLHDFILSGDCYKIRLFASILNIEYETVLVDFFPGKEHETESFLRLNPLGDIPVLEDGDLVLHDSKAILLYLANLHDVNKIWWPMDNAVLLGKTAQWLAFSDKISKNVSAARWHKMIGQETDISCAQRNAHDLFRILEDHFCMQEFEGIDWIIDKHPTLADIACFSFTALAGDGDITLYHYPAIQRWLRRVTLIPGFIDMPGINIKH